MYPAMAKSLGQFSLEVEGGQFTDSEIIVMLGENGTGKTTFIRLMAGLLKPDSDGMFSAHVLNEDSSTPTLPLSISGSASNERQLQTTKD